MECNLISKNAFKCLCSSIDHCHVGKVSIGGIWPNVTTSISSPACDCYGTMENPVAHNKTTGPPPWGHREDGSRKSPWTADVPGCHSWAEAEDFTGTAAKLKAQSVHPLKVRALNDAAGCVASSNCTSIGSNEACNITPTKTMKAASEVLDESLLGASRLF